MRCDLKEECHCNTEHTERCKNCCHNKLNAKTAFNKNSFYIPIKFGKNKEFSNIKTKEQK